MFFFFCNLFALKKSGGFCDGPNTTTNGMQNQLRIVVNWYAKYKENQTKKKK